MSLYVRFTGERIRLTAAALQTVWVVFSKENIDWYYEKPKKLQRGQRVEVNRVWHVQAVYTESSKARSCREGAAVWNGRWEPEDGVVADGGIREIHDGCRAINPTDAERERRSVAA
jgi:hypothetical protein